MFSTHGYITVYYTVALTKAKNNFEDRVLVRLIIIIVSLDTKNKIIHRQ